MKGKMRKARIMVFGTFDGLHAGHLNFFKQAKKLAKNSFLIVSIARDKNVKKIKGRLPVFKERERVKLIKNSEGVDRVVLGGDKNHLPHILKERPTIIGLGYDQRDYVKNLKNDLKKMGLLVKIVRLEPFKENIYKNHLLKKKNKK